jgi:hypothetical protein
MSSSRSSKDTISALWKRYNPSFSLYLYSPKTTRGVDERRRRREAAWLVRFRPSSLGNSQARSSSSRSRTSTPTTATPHTMQSLRRTAVFAARTGRTTLPRQPRRFAHDEHSHGHGHASASEPMGVRQAPIAPHTARAETPHGAASSLGAVR